MEQQLTLAEISSKINELNSNLEKYKIRIHYCLDTEEDTLKLKINYDYITREEIDFTKPVDLSDSCSIKSGEYCSDDNVFSVK